MPALFIFNRVTQNTILTTILDYILPFIGIYAICVLSRGIKHWNYATQKLLVISASSYIIYLFHTTFEGFVKSLIHKVPTLANGNNSLYFTIGAALIVGAGVILPIVLHRRILSQNRVLRFLFGLKPVKQPAKSCGVQYIQYFLKRYFIMKTVVQGSLITTFRCNAKCNMCNIWPDQPNRKRK